MSDPEPIEFDFEDGPPKPGDGGAGDDGAPGDDGAGDDGAPGDDGFGVEQAPAAGVALAAGVTQGNDPLHAHAAAVSAAAAGAAFAVTSYPYAPAAIQRVTPAWSERATHGAGPAPWSRRRRLTMGILLALLALSAATVIALSIRAIDVFLRGG